MEKLKKFLREKKITLIYLMEHTGYSIPHLSRVLNRHDKHTEKFIRLIRMVVRNKMDESKKLLEVEEKIFDEIIGELLNEYR